MNTDLIFCQKIRWNFCCFKTVMTCDARSPVLSTVSLPPAKLVRGISNHLKPNALTVNHSTGLVEDGHFSGKKKQKKKQKTGGIPVAIQDFPSRSAISSNLFLSDNQTRYPQHRQHSHHPVLTVSSVQLLTCQRADLAW